MRYIFFKDAYGLTYLHYAISCNSEKIVSKLLKIANDEKTSFYQDMYLQEKGHSKHADLDYCLIKGSFPILKLLLNDMIKQKVIKKYLNKGVIFTDETLATTSLENLQQLSKMLTEKKFANTFKSTDLSKRLSQAILNKQTTMSESAKLSNAPTKIFSDIRKNPKTARKSGLVVSPRRINNTN